VEECTAQAAVCPAWLAPRLFLRDCEKKRLRIVARLADVFKRVLDCRDQCNVGKWLLAVHAMQRQGEGAGSQGQSSQRRCYDCDEIADFAVGLLFAAHKNPSIAAAQSVLFMLEFDKIRQEQQSTAPGDEGAITLVGQVQAEALSLQQKVLSHSATSNRSSSSSDSSSKISLLDCLGEGGGDAGGVIERVVVETLRVTAHSIGSVRKVMAPEGWAVTVCDPCSDGESRGVVRYVLPCSSYVGVSHIIPHRDQLRYCTTQSTLFSH
jgi:hypothetical protein